MSKQPLQIPVSPLLVEQLKAGWSRPVQLKIEDGELICQSLARVYVDEGNCGSYFYVTAGEDVEDE